MFEIKGKYTTANVYALADGVEASCIAQITRMVNHEAFTGPIAIMPDTHAGKGSVIGFTMPLGPKLGPQIVGVDIGCGMSALIIPYPKKTHEAWDFAALDHQIRRSVPTGFHIHKEPQMYDFNWGAANRAWSQFGIAGKPAYTELWFRETCNRIGCELGRAYNSPGTLGGGNHFIEMDYDELTGNYWLIVHSGSRKFGECVCRYWQKKAGKDELAFLDMSGEGADYLHDMAFAQRYASYNRQRIVDAIVQDLKRLDIINPNVLNETEECVHNFIDPTDRIIRKGAINARPGRTIIVPVNMAFGTIVGLGNSNESWNYSAPHGAGRRMSRTQAKKSLDMSRFQEQMSGVFSTSVRQSTLDEAPDAYKDGNQIYEALRPIMDNGRILKPIWNMKDV